MWEYRYRVRATPTPLRLASHTGWVHIASGRQLRIDILVPGWPL